MYSITIRLVIALAVAAQIVVLSSVAEARYGRGAAFVGGAAATAVVAGGVRAAGYNAGYNTYYGGAGYNTYYGGPGYDAYYGGAGYVPGPRCGYGPYPPCE